MSCLDESCGFLLKVRSSRSQLRSFASVDPAAELSPLDLRRVNSTMLVVDAYVLHVFEMIQICG